MEAAAAPGLRRWRRRRRQRGEGGRREGGGAPRGLCRRPPGLPGGPAAGAGPGVPRPVPRPVPCRQVRRGGDERSGAAAARAQPPGRAQPRWAPRPAVGPRRAAPAGGRPRYRPRPFGRGAAASRGRGCVWGGSVAGVARGFLLSVSRYRSSPQGPAPEKVSRLWRDSCDMCPPRRGASPGQRNPRLRSETGVLLTVKRYIRPVGVSGAAGLLGHSSRWARSGSWYRPVPLGQARLPPGI